MICSYCRTELTTEARDNGYCHKCGAPFSMLSVGSVNKIRSVKGNAITMDVIEGVFQELFENGSVCQRIVTDVWGQRKLSDFYEGFMTTNRIGGELVKQLVDPICGNVVTIAIDRNLRGEMYFVSASGSNKITEYSTSC